MLWAKQSDDMKLRFSNELSLRSPAISSWPKASGSWRAFFNKRNMSDERRTARRASLPAFVTGLFMAEIIANKI